MHSNIPNTPSTCPAWMAGLFSQEGPERYRAWRDHKLANYPAKLHDLLVEIDDPSCLTPHEQARVMAVAAQCNLVFFQCRAPERMNRSVLRQMGKQFGLVRIDCNLCAEDDGVSALEDREIDRANDYIPYSNRPLSWHTDGYYNPPERQVRGWILYCARSAAEGGENALLDPEIAYILMREENPAWIKALMLPDAMTIPANVENGILVRPAETGPVFSPDPQTGSLHMRYSARKRYIAWKPNDDTTAARRFLDRLLSGQSPYIFRHRLAPGQGVASNNVLHNRSGYQDDASTRRLYYRARYYERLADSPAAVTGPPGAPAPHPAQYQAPNNTG